MMTRWVEAERSRSNDLCGNTYHPVRNPLSESNDSIGLPISFALKHPDFEASKRNLRKGRFFFCDLGSHWKIYGSIFRRRNGAKSAKVVRWVSVDQVCVAEIRGGLPDEGTERMPRGYREDTERRTRGYADLHKVGLTCVNHGFHPANSD